MIKSSVIKGGVPKGSEWGLQVEGDKTARAVLAALPNPRFFVCFYTKENDPPDKIHVLLHGKATISQLIQIGDMTMAIIEGLAI